MIARVVVPALNGGRRIRPVIKIEGVRSLPPIMRNPISGSQAGGQTESDQNTPPTPLRKPGESERRKGDQKPTIVAGQAHPPGCYDGNDQITLFLRGAKAKQTP